MLSRVAENLYWMARYLERAENTARLINATTQTLLDLPQGARFGWDVLIRVVGLDGLYSRYHDTADETTIVYFLILDARNPSAIFSSIRHARENTRTFREVLPMDLWERINDLFLYIEREAPNAVQNRNQRYEILNGVIQRRHGIVGLLAGSMSHDVAYQFIKLGRNVERADMTTRIVDVNSAVLLPRKDEAAAAAVERLWVGTLRALSAYEMYRRHRSVHVHGEAVVDFLLKDEHFPRTVHHCLNEIESCLAGLPDYETTMRAARRAWRRLMDMKLEGLPATVLHEYLDQVQTDIGSIHAALARQYFHLHQAAQPA